MHKRLLAAQMLEATLFSRPHLYDVSPAVARQCRLAEAGSLCEVERDSLLFCDSFHPKLKEAIHLHVTPS